MDDERDDALEGPEPFEQDGPPLFEQDGPDLFGETAELTTAPAASPKAAIAVQEPPLDDEPSSAVNVPAPPSAVVDATISADPTPERPDAPLALYRRYRPDTFADVIGQEHVTEPLQRALTNNKVNHAYLFSGPRGCGKTTSARILARALNCAKGPTPVPCGRCQSCRDLARGGPGSIDVIEIDAASHGGVDDARDLRERAFFAPMASRYKIYIVDEAHMVTTAGFNALLKVVEEPPPHVKFIFATTEPDKVIGTIRSRTHHYPFRLVPPRTLTAYLASLCEAEGVQVDATALPLVVRAGAGSVRDSLSVLDQLLGGAAEAGVTYTQAAALLGYTPETLLDEIVDAFAAGDARAVFGCIDKVMETGQDPRRFAEDLLRRLRDLIVVAAVPDALSTGLVDVAGDQAERLRTQATALGPGELTRGAEVIANGLTEMRGTTAPRLHLELMCARVLLPGADVDDRGLHARLDRLERRAGMAQSAQPSTPRDGDGPVRAAMSAPATTQAVSTSATGAPPTSTPGSAASTPRPATSGEATTGSPPGGNSANRTASASSPPPSQASEVAGTAPDTASAEPEPRPAEAPGSVSAEDHSQPSTSADPPPNEPHPEGGTPTPSAAGSRLSTVDFRRLWPQILDQVKTRRRFTWILLSQNAHVLDVVDGVLSLGISNSGARDSFSRGGSEDVLRESILAAIGESVTISVVVEPGDQPTAQASAAPRAQQTSTPPADPPRSDTVHNAKANLRPTSKEAEPATPGAEPSRDDESLDEEAGNHNELLAKHLGAELIAEED